MVAALMSASVTMRLRKVAQAVPDEPKSGVKSRALRG